MCVSPHFFIALKGRSYLHWKCHTFHVGWFEEKFVAVSCHYWSIATPVLWLYINCKSWMFDMLSFLCTGFRIRNLLFLNYPVPSVKLDTQLWICFMLILHNRPTPPIDTLWPLGLVHRNDPPINAFMCSWIEVFSNWQNFVRKYLSQFYYPPPLFWLKMALPKINSSQ